MGDHNSRTCPTGFSWFGESNDNPSDLMFGTMMRLCFDLNIHYRDLKSLRRRYEQEGSSFLTKTLPLLGKALDQGLGSGHFKCPTNFRRTSHLPVFLGSLFRRIFDQETGLVRSDVCTHSVKCVRQLTFLCYKAEMPYSDKEKNRVLDAFKSTEEELESDKDYGGLAAIANLFCKEVFNDFDWELTRPKDGPGVVSNMDTPYGKSEKKLSPISSVGERLVDFFFSPECLLDDVTRLSQREYRNIRLNRSLPAPGSNSWATAGRLPCYGSFDFFRNGGVAKMILVPKDSRGPRLISCEPQENQYLQQGIMAYMVDRFESHWLTSGSVNFTDQSVNQNCAKEASLSQKYATLDLKDASDRVSMALVRQVFKGLDLLGALELVRSPRSKFPQGYTGGTVILMKKHAPMGSAVCFPVLAGVIYFLGCAYLLKKGVDVEEISGHLKVYGDDIIISTQYATEFIEVLENHDLRVNTSKSFINSCFAESCGHDYVRGVLVTPVRLKKVNLMRDWPDAGPDVFPFNKRTRNGKWFRDRYALPRRAIITSKTMVQKNPYPTQTLISLTESANLFLSNGLIQTAEFLFRYVESWLGVLPLGSPESPYLCRWGTEKERNLIPESNYLNPHVRWKSQINQMTGKWEEVMCAWGVKTRQVSTNSTPSGHMLRVHRIWGSKVETPSPGIYQVPRGVELERGWYTEDKQYSHTVCRWLP